MTQATRAPYLPRENDAARAYRAVWALRAVPHQAVPFLRQHVRPPTGGLDYERIDQLIAHLDDNAFSARERAETYMHSEHALEQRLQGMEKSQRLRILRQRSQGVVRFLRGDLEV